MESKRLVQCKVSAGFFGSEYLVVVAGSSAFVDRDSVRVKKAPKEGEVDGRVEAYVIEEAEDKALIELPGELVVGGARTWVPKTLLTAASA